MKIDIISDVHWNAWATYYDALAKPDVDVLEIYKTEGVEVCLFAGDAGDGMPYYFEFIRKLRSLYKYVIGVPGNHDHANSDPMSILSICQNDIGNASYIIDGTKIVTSTLWTNFRNNEGFMEDAEHSIIDFHQICFMTGELMKQRNEEAVEFLRRYEDADIVMTHFAPSLQSIHPIKYAGDPTNPYFANDMNDLVEHMDPSFWIHGHTHTKFDYEIGNTRVICNPHGYPNESSQYPIVQPKMIEI